MTSPAAIDVRDMRVGYEDLTAVRGVSFTVPAGGRMGLVGESGSGKSMTALALMGLLPAGWSTDGEVLHDGVNLATEPDKAFSARRGRTISMVFQDPMSSLNPVRRVGDQIADALVEKIVPQIQALKIGAGTSCGLDMGPLVTAQARDKVKGYIDAGVEQGAKLVVDGRGLVVPGNENGFFVGGTLFDNVTPEMTIYTDEIFGPVLCIVRVGSLEEAMQLINDHEYGNGTCIFTRDGEAARLFCDEIEVGMVGVNVPLPVPVSYHSFGGWKRSLFGDLHAYGPDGVRFYTRKKAITQRWPARKSHEAAQFAFPSNG